jgi:hypothetical protein
MSLCTATRTWALCDSLLQKALPYRQLSCDLQNPVKDLFSRNANVCFVHRIPLPEGQSSSLTLDTLLDHRQERIFAYNHCNTFNMADVEDIDMDDWHLRKFRVPDPPQKPDFLQGAENMHWAQFSRKLAAKLNIDKTAFDVGLYDPADPTAYRLGPPSGIPDYPHLLEKYGVQVLAAAGFLNHKINQTSDHINGRLAFKPWRRNIAHDVRARIHPVFEQRKWDGIIDRQYFLMLPALQLATAILDDPITLSYFHALAMPSDSMETVSHVSAELTADCKIMKIPDALDEHQQREAFRKLHWMMAYLEDWGFNDGDLKSLAYTRKVNSPGGGPRSASKP